MVGLSKNSTHTTRKPSNNNSPEDMRGFFVYGRKGKERAYPTSCPVSSNSTVLHTQALCDSPTGKAHRDGDDQVTRKLVVGLCIRSRRSGNSLMRTLANTSDVPSTLTFLAHPRQIQSSTWERKGDREEVLQGS